MSIVVTLIVLAVIAIPVGILVLATKKTPPSSTPLPGKNMTRLQYWLWFIGTYIAATIIVAVLNANHAPEACGTIVGLVWWIMVGVFACARAVDAGRKPWVWVVIAMLMPAGFIVLGCFRTASCRRIESIVAHFDWSAA
jgi:hypothetical protein